MAGIRIAGLNEPPEYRSNYLNRESKCVFQENISKLNRVHLKLFLDQILQALVLFHVKHVHDF